MQKFEYKVEKICLCEGRFNEILHRKERYYKSPEQATEDLNALGEEGWELCGVVHGDYIFKRRVPNSEANV